MKILKEEFAGGGLGLSVFSVFLAQYYQCTADLVMTLTKCR